MEMSNAKTSSSLNQVILLKTDRETVNIMQTISVHTIVTINVNDGDGKTSKTSRQNTCHDQSVTAVQHLAKDYFILIVSFF